MKNLEDIKILVVGDIMLDKYVVGDVSRISPEAPVPIVKVSDEYSTLGGCGNVVRNIREVGPKVFCLAAIGNDIEGRMIMDKLMTVKAHPQTFFGLKQTIVKERIIADQRKVQMLRIDREHVWPVDHEKAIEKCKELSEYFFTIEEIDKPYDMIVVSDYGKGMITWELMEHLRTLNTDIIVDPKPQNSGLYQMVTMITPNKDEWRKMQLHNNNSEFVLVTEGRDGMTLYDNRQGWSKIKIEAKPVDVYNVSGAGDTVVAIMSICLALDIYPDKAARIANDCAAYVVTQPGTSIVPQEIFINSLSYHR